MKSLKMLKSLSGIGGLFYVLFTNITYAACVNNIEKDAPIERFDVKGADVLDKYTGLIWQRCSVGQEWNTEKSRCHLKMESARLFTWQEAHRWAQNVRKITGQSWRLPNRNELSSIVERACTGPAINETIFPSTVPDRFWTSTPSIADKTYAWHVNFKTGDSVNEPMNQSFSLRLVREVE